ncbi:hypothetical protein SteCoe_28234 [Stentor coeruleus]|uniref:DAGKc domain-containing protein n=1 Tax=Stentor coeruleus TaxID=5963 RepID=A0A1R2B8N0_9CILI|nr:hypothetical protein SteCoe_28234 [Stentor coeruleus]
MKPLDTVLVHTDKGQETYLNLTSDYLYWENNGRLYSYHTDEVLGGKFQDNSLSIVVYRKSRFRFFKFSCENGTHFENSLSSTLNPCYKFFLIVYNPISGTGTSKAELFNTFLPVLSLTPHRYEVYQTTSQGYPIPLIERIGSEFTDVIILGGDGTLHLLLSALYKRNRQSLKEIGIAVLASGSRNSLAVELHGKSFNEGIYNILKNCTVLGDLMLVKTDEDSLLATTAVTCGLGADLPYEAEKNRNLGLFRFALAGVKALIMPWKHYFCSFKCEKSDGEEFERIGEFLWISIGNNKAQNLRNDEIPFPYAYINSGDMDAVLIDPIYKLMTTRLFFQILNGGQHVNNPAITYIKLKKAEIKFEQCSVFNIDGEMHFSKKVEVEILEKALKYYGKLESFN